MADRIFVVVLRLAAKNEPLSFLELERLVQHRKGKNPQNHRRLLHIWRINACFDLQVLLLIQLTSARPRCAEKSAEKIWPRK